MNNDTYVLTVNAGSSSLKFALFSTSPIRALSLGEVKNIGTDNSSLRIKDWRTKHEFTHELSAPNHQAAAHSIVQWLKTNLELGSIAAVGHRVVHGGPNFDTHTRITPELKEKLRQLTVLDPLHMPIALQLIDTFEELLPGKEQVACFDTVFHHNLPLEARLLPLPRRYTDQGLRRFGFHGLSYAYLQQTLTRLHEGATLPGKTILAHLGSGVSVAAVKDGQPFDTTMAVTPASGLPMSNRSGDTDPGLIAYIMRTENLTADGLDKLVNNESGLRGISDLTNDMKQLIEQSESNAKAKEAVDVFCYNVKKTIGAYATAMNGVDTIVFTGGIGEEAPVVRAKILSNVEVLGITLDEAANKDNHPVISTGDSRVQVRIIPTNEALIIAQETVRLTTGGSSP